jgi:hypothetical protein
MNKGMGRGEPPAHVSLVVKLTCGSCSIISALPFRMLSGERASFTVQYVALLEEMLSNIRRDAEASTINFAYQA